MWGGGGGGGVLVLTGLLNRGGGGGARQMCTIELRVFFYICVQFGMQSILHMRVIWNARRWKLEVELVSGGGGGGGGWGWIPGPPPPCNCYRYYRAKGPHSVVAIYNEG